MTDFFEQLEADLVARVELVYPESGADVVSCRHGRREIGRAASAMRVRAWAAIGAVIGAAAVGVLMIISVAPTTTNLDVTRTSRGLLSIVADGPLGIVALNERMTAMGLPVRVLGTSQGCDASALIVGPAGRSGVRRPLGLTTMRVTAPSRSRTARRAWLSARVALPRRLGQTVVLTVVDGGRRMLEQTVAGPIPACVRVLPVAPTASALTG